MQTHEHPSLRKEELERMRIAAEYGKKARSREALSEMKRLRDEAAERAAQAAREEEALRLRIKRSKASGTASSEEPKRDIATTKTFEVTSGLPTGTTFPKEKPVKKRKNVDVDADTIIAEPFDDEAA